MYETSAEGYDTARWLGLTDAERRVEQLCDEERYRALHTNEDEEELYRGNYNFRNPVIQKELVRPWVLGTQQKELFLSIKLVFSSRIWRIFVSKRKKQQWPE